MVDTKGPLSLHHPLHTQIQMTPEELKAKIRSCTACPLHKGRTLGVPGYANTPHPRLAVVGESAGRVEDEFGTPHVGPAGVYLRKALQSAGFHEDEVLFTNIVRCISFGPAPSEAIAECKKWTDEEYNLYKPSVVLLMGRGAINTVWPTSNVVGIRGSYGIFGGTVFVPTYNPAAVLRNEELKDLFLSDLVLARELCEQLTR